jgi:hypothetical protein
MGLCCFGGDDEVRLEVNPEHCRGSLSTRLRVSAHIYHHSEGFLRLEKLLQCLKFLEFPGEVQNVGQLFVSAYPVFCSRKSSGNERPTYFVLRSPIILTS